MHTVIALPEMARPRRRGAEPKAVFVIAKSDDGRTYIGPTALGIYEHGIHKRLLPDWSCGVGDAAGDIYEMLERECPMDEVARVGYFTTTPFATVQKIARDAIASLKAQLEGIAA